MASRNAAPLPPSSIPNPSAETSRPPRFPSFLISMVLLALVIRLVVMVFLLPEQLDPQRDHWRFGYETGRIARSIAQGRGFSNPLFGDTGPTAWRTPAYPHLAASVSKLFGVYSQTSAIVLRSMNVSTALQLCIPIVVI